MSNTLRESVERTHIEDVFRRRSEVGDNTTSMANVLNQQMSQLFHDPRNFIYELLQNAEDANATSIIFTIVNSSLIVSYNGSPFTRNDVERICDLSRDTDSDAAAKPNQEEKIGYKGIGFKSVFGISKEISILSPATNYFFRFSKRHRGKEDYFLSKTDPSNKFPWQIIPIWIEESERMPGAHENDVTLVLDDVDLAKIQPELATLVSQSEILVFLNKIQAISYIDGSTRYAIRKHATDSEELIKIEQTNSLGFTETLWHTYHADIAIERSITDMMQDLDLSAKMKSAKFMQLSFAVPVIERASHYKFIPFTKGSLFCHLPTAVTCHLPFLINAKFTLNQDRSMLLNDVRNNFLLEKIAIEQFKWFAKLAQNPLYQQDVLQLLNHQDVADVFPQLNRQAFQEDKLNSVACDLPSAYYRGFKSGFTKVAFILSKNTDLLCLSECVIDTTDFFKEIDERFIDQSLTVGKRSRIVAYDLNDRHRLMQFAEKYTEQNLLDNISCYMEKTVEDNHKSLRSSIVRFIRQSPHSRSFWMKKILLNTSSALCIPLESFMSSQQGLHGLDLSIFRLDIIDTQQYEQDIGTLLSSAIDLLTLESLICKHLAKMIRDNQITLDNSVPILQFLYKAVVSDPSILSLLRQGSGDVDFARFKVITQDRQLRELKNCFFPLTANDAHTCAEFQLANEYGINSKNHANWRDLLACFGVTTSAKLTEKSGTYEAIYLYFNNYLSDFCLCFETYAQNMMNHVSADNIPASARAGKKKVAELLKNISFENLLLFPFLFLNQNPSTLNLFYQALNEQQMLITQKPTIRRSGGDPIEIKEHFLTYYFRQSVFINVYGKTKHSKLPEDLFYLPQLLECFDSQDLPIDVAQIPIPLTAAVADFLGFKRFISLQQGLDLLTALNQGREPRELDHHYFLRLRAIYHLMIQIDLAKEDISIIHSWKQQNVLFSRKKTFVIAKDLKIFDELSLSANPKNGYWLHDAGLESHEFKQLARVLGIPCHSENDDFIPTFSTDEDKIEALERLKSFILDSLPLIVLREFQELATDTASLHQTLFKTIRELAFIYCEFITVAEVRHHSYVKIKEKNLYVAGKMVASIAEALGKKFFESESTRREFKQILGAFSTQERNNDFLQKRVSAIPTALKSKYDEMFTYQTTQMNENRSIRKLEFTAKQPDISATQTSTVEKAHSSASVYSSPEVTKQGRRLSGGSGGHSFFFDPSNSPVTHTPSHCKKDTALAAIGNRPADLGSHKKVAEANVTSEEEGAVAEKELKNKKIGDMGEKCVFLKIKHLLGEQLKVEPTELTISMPTTEGSAEVVMVPSTRFMNGDQCIDVIWFNKDRGEEDMHESPVDMVIRVNNENRYFIEIKSTATAYNPIFFLTSNEWRYMREKRKNSILVRAYGIGSMETRFEVYQDPFGMIMNDLITFMTGGKFRLKVKTAEEALEHHFSEDQEIGCRLS